MSAWSKKKQRKYAREHYYTNPQRYIEANRRRVASNRELITAAKSNPCTDCGKTYPPYVMDFDHVRGKKKFRLAQHMKVGLPGLLAEIAKCDLVCANCHRERTYQRTQADQRAHKP